jgi:hypothetical protein
LAQELRDIIEQAKKSNVKNLPVSIAKSLKDSDGLLAISHPKYKLSDLISSDDVRGKLERLIREQRHITKLKNHRLSPRRHILLVGPQEQVKHSQHQYLQGCLISRCFKYDSIHSLQNLWVSHLQNYDKFLMP